MSPAIIFLLAATPAATLTPSEPIALSALSSHSSTSFSSKVVALRSNVVALRTERDDSDRLAADDDIEWQRMGLTTHFHVPEEAFSRVSSRRQEALHVNVRADDAPVDCKAIDWHRMGLAGSIQIPGAVPLTTHTPRPKRVKLGPPGISFVVGKILGREDGQNGDQPAHPDRYAERDMPRPPAVRTSQERFREA